MFGISSKLFVVYVLLAGFVLQYSQKAFVLIDFIYNQEEIAQTKCENRFKTILVCKGSCVLAKKIIEVEKHETKSPTLPKFDEKPPFFQDLSFNLKFIENEIVHQKFNFISQINFQSFFLSIFHPPD
jgi:hypothetical protein